MSDGRPPRPDPLPCDPDAVPDKLRQRDAWVCWRYKWASDRDEWTKIPLDPNSGEFASSTDADTWGAFTDAVDYQGRDDTDTDGIGYVVHDEDAVVGLDLDDCRDATTGDLEDWASDVIDTVPTYAEVSPSGTGLRLFGLGFIPTDDTRGDVEDSDDGHIEMYETGRYLTVTGATLDDAPGDVRQVNDAVEDVHTEYILDDPDTPKPTGDGGVEVVSQDENPTLDGRGPGSTGLSDSEILDKAKNAENGDKFRRLWRGDTSGYPSHSEADLALCGLLAFWTGGDRQQIDRLFRESDLYRDKWDRDDYRKRTVDQALAGNSDYYDPHSGGGQRPNTPQRDVDQDGGIDLALCPREVVAWAGLGEDEDVSDLTDREKAACVWDILKEHDDYHVRVRRDTDELWAYDDGIWKPDGERTLRHVARRALGSMNYGQNVLQELKAQARSDPAIEVPGDEFGVSPGQIAVENGLLDLDDAASGAGEDSLRELRPQDHALARLPVTYDPAASYDEWADYVDEWAENDRAKALQEYVGYCLHVGALPIHRALLLVGSGANGKGTFLHVVRELLGPENTSAIELQTLANEKDAVADFYGALANIDDDLSARKLGQGLGMFKKLVGGDRVRARRLYQDGFEFDAVGKHLYAANEVPQVDVDDEDEAFWRRWLLVEFPNHYPKDERNETLRDDLSTPAKLSGVLNWAIEGRARLLDQGYFTNEDYHAFEKRERWQAWGDSMDTFISECVERDEDAANVSTSDVHRVYAAWCRENGEKPASQQRFTTKLKTENFGYGQSVRPGGTGTPARGFKALSFTDDAPDLDDTPERDSGQQQLG